MGLFYAKVYGTVKFIPMLTFYYGLSKMSFYWQATTPIHKLCADTEWRLEDLPCVMTYRDG